MTAVLCCVIALVMGGLKPAPASDGVSWPSQESSTVRGVVVDAKTAAPIADARVLIVETARSIKTGADGRFEFVNVAPGKYTISVSTIGYIFVRRTIQVGARAALELTIPLSEGTGTYQETVTVTAASITPPEVASQSELGSAALQDLRGVAADDPMRALQALPGVATGDDFQAQFSVRGSAFRHIGLVIDGTATPFLLHTVRSIEDAGSIAMINTDVLDHASLLAGPHPQQHGDWIGATLEFGIREGSRDRSQVRGAVSGTSASTVVEGPIGRSKRGSWLASIRKSYVDWLIRKIDPEIDSTIGFWDGQGKIAYDLGRRQQVQFMFVGGNAVYHNYTSTGANGLYRANSRSALGSAVWRYTRDTLLVTQRVSFAGNKFRDAGSIDQELGVGYGHSAIWRGDALWLPNKTWTVQGGLKSEWQHQTLTERTFAIVNSRAQQRAIMASEHNTTLPSLWGEVARRTATTGISAGTRVTADSLSGDTVTSPWVLGEQKIGAFTFRAGAGIAHQFPELELQGSLKDRLPARARSIDLSVERQLPFAMRALVIGFTRQDRNVIRRIGEDQLVNGRRSAAVTFQQLASSLDGQSRGVDFVVSRRGTSSLTGWVSYTYAHTQYHDRLTAEAFDGDFDQRHTLNVFVEQRLSYRLAVNAKFRYGSNFPLVGYFQGTPPDGLALAPERNQVRLPSYARLDLRANQTFTFNRHRLTLFLELMNATGRRNVGQADGFIRASTLQAVDYVQKLIPFVPSVGMLIEF